MQAIDMHGHVVPEGVVLQLQKSPNTFPNVSVRHLDAGRAIFSFNGVEQPQPLVPELMDVPGILTYMDKARVDIQVEGIWSGIFGYMLPVDEAAAWSRFLNEEILLAIRGSRRLLAVATVPIQDSRCAILEMEAAKKMRFPGVTIGTEGPGRALDDAVMEPFWEAAEALDMPVFLHPMHLTEPRLQAYRLPTIVGRTVDTTIAASRLLCAGVLLRYPKLKLILSHGGGMLPYLLGRLGRHYQITPGIADPVAGFGHLYFDSCVYRPEILRFLVELVGKDRVMMGTDSPFSIADPRPRELIEESGFDQETVEAILVGNTQRIFGIQEAQTDGDERGR